MSPLDRLAAKASRDSFFLGFALAAYQSRTGTTDADLARLLCCTVPQLAGVRLCRTPATDEDVRRIAAKWVLSESGLRETLAILRNQFAGG